MVRTEKTHYETLGVSPGAKDTDIRYAYIMLARRLHPDTGNEPNGDKFAEITEAYEALKQPDKRRLYDAQLALLMAQCPACDGTGLSFRYQGFHARREMPCGECKGTGRA